MEMLTKVTKSKRQDSSREQVLEQEKNKVARKEKIYLLGLKIKDYYVGKERENYLWSTLH